MRWAGETCGAHTAAIIRLEAVVCVCVFEFYTYTSHTQPLTAIRPEARVGYKYLPPHAAQRWQST